MSKHPDWTSSAAIFALALACRPASDVAPAHQGTQVSWESIEAMETRIERDGEEAAEALVRLVVASPVDLPAGEFDRLGRLLLVSSDSGRLMERLNALAVTEPDSRELQAWLDGLAEYEASIVRGVDVEVGY